MSSMIEIENISGTISDNHPEAKPSDLLENQDGTKAWYSQSAGGFLILTLKEVASIQDVTITTDDGQTFDHITYGSLNKRDWFPVNPSAEQPVVVGKFVKIITLQQPQEDGTNTEVAIKGVTVTGTPIPVTDLTEDQKFQLDGGFGSAPPKEAEVEAEAGTA
jgi:hypothetical protein